MRVAPLRRLSIVIMIVGGLAPSLALADAQWPPYDDARIEKNCGSLPSIQVDEQTILCRVEASADRSGRLHVESSVAPVTTGVNPGPGTAPGARASAAVIARYDVSSPVSRIRFTIRYRIHRAEARWSRTLYDLVQSDPQAGPVMTAWVQTIAEATHDCGCGAVTSLAPRGIVNDAETVEDLVLDTVIDAPRVFGGNPGGPFVPAGTVEIVNGLDSYAELSCTYRGFVGVCRPDDVGRSDASADATIEWIHAEVTP